MLIAVTGATGFIGGSAARRLVKDGHQVMAFGRRPTCNVPGAIYRSWDITRGPIEAGRVDAVVHCAGSVTDWATAREFEAANVTGTRHVLETFRTADVFVHLSTASVYSLTGPKVSITEDAPLGGRFVSPYSRSKIAAEQLVRTRAGATVVLRPHIVYGPGESKILPRLLAVLRRGPLLVPGDGRNRLSVTHIENLVDAITSAAERREGHELFNIADADSAGVDVLLSSLQTAFAFERRPIRHVPFGIAWPAAIASEAAHRTLLRHRSPVLTRFLVAQLAFDFTLDINRARRILGYRPRRSYAEALPELAATALVPPPVAS